MRTSFRPSDDPRVLNMEEEEWRQEEVSAIWFDERDQWEFRLDRMHPVQGPRWRA